MAENKTRQTGASVADYLAAIEDPQRRKDCEALARVMQKATGEKPAMWGPGIAISVYVSPDFVERELLLAKLGPHTSGKSCLSVKRFAEIDKAVLEKLVKASAASTRKRYA